MVIVVFASFTFLGKGSFQQEDESGQKLEEAFFLLDSVWAPNSIKKFELFPLDNYLHIKNGWATVMVDLHRGKSFHGPITNVKIEDDENGKRTTSFSVRNAQMKLELKELDDDRFEIFMYKYLGGYEKYFSAQWIDLTKVKLTIEEDND